MQWSLGCPDQTWNKPTSATDTAGRLRREKCDVDGADTSFQTTVHTYDAAGNRITTKVPGNHTTTFDYDALDRRVSKTVDTLTTKYLLDGAMEVAEYDGATDALLLRYVYGPGMTAPVAEISAAGARRYLHPDAIGSVVAVTGAGGGAALGAADAGEAAGARAAAAASPATSGLRMENPVSGSGTTLSYTVEAARNRQLLVAVLAVAEGSRLARIDRVDFAGIRMTRIGSRATIGSHRLELYRLDEADLGNGARQSGQILATTRYASTAKIQAFTLHDAAQGRPADDGVQSQSATVTALSATIPASRATTPALALSFLGLDAADTWTADPDQTQVAYQSDAAAGVALGSAQELVTAPKAPPDLTTLGWSGTVAIKAGMFHVVFEEDTSGTPPGGGGGDPAGAEEYYAYGPFGEGSDAGNGTIAYRYAGHRFDPETELYYMRARYYSVKAGRFLSPDPIGYGDGPNMYGYVGNDPINFIDPLGLSLRAAKDRALAVGLNAGVSPLTSAQINNTRTGNGMPYMNISFDAAFDDFIAEQLATSEFDQDSLLVAGPTKNLKDALKLLKTSPNGKRNRIVPGVGRFASNRSKGFDSFGAFKREFGEAGEGLEWHHIVGQFKANIIKFGEKKIHNTRNLITVDTETHRLINSFYSSTQRWTGGLTVRDWLKPQSYKFQHSFGRGVLRMYGVLD